MINIHIKGEEIDINTDDKEKGTTGATKEELKLLKSIAAELCGDCKEGSE